MQNICIYPSFVDNRFGIFILPAKSGPSPQSANELFTIPKKEKIYILLLLYFYTIIVSNVGFLQLSLCFLLSHLSHGALFQ